MELSSPPQKYNHKDKIFLTEVKPSLKNAHTLPNKLQEKTDSSDSVKHNLELFENRVKNWQKKKLVESKEYTNAIYNNVEKCIDTI